MHTTAELRPAAPDGPEPALQRLVHVELVLRWCNARGALGKRPVGRLTHDGIIEGVDGNMSVGG